MGPWNQGLCSQGWSGWVVIRHKVTVRLDVREARIFWQYSVLSLREGGVDIGLNEFLLSGGLDIWERVFFLFGLRDVSIELL